MLLRLLYYHLKPSLPRGFRMAIRRGLANRIRRRAGHSWPILESASLKPEGWPGWPEGKQFAFVLTHDVESEVGVPRCQLLAEIDREYGFRSAFNFVPEGGYAIPPEFRSWLTNEGFEVGVQDLHHDGKLYRSRKAFRDSAAKINRYLKAWNAVGFRSGFMFHNLDWAHDLDVEYDSSTFDIDPFEPQPDGVGTIFPFWVPTPGLSLTPTLTPTLTLNPSQAAQKSEVRGQKSEVGNHISSITNHKSPIINPQSAINSQLSQPTSDLLPLTSGLGLQESINSQLTTLNYPRSGYVELPYTLPQDSTVFNLLQEKSIDIWKQKLDWVAANGGMALLNVHPDYLAFDSGNVRLGYEYPVEWYRQFLAYVKSRYAGRYWHALPRDMARFIAAQQAASKASHAPVAIAPRKPGMESRGRIWIDLDNTPHVPFFQPMIPELEAAGYEVLLTARDAFQVCDLADLKGLRYRRIGRHYGKNRVLKVMGLFYRALQLMPFALRNRPVLGLSHGSRSQIIICNLLRIPSILIADYEFAKALPLMHPTWEIIPESISEDSVHCDAQRVRKFPGLKEDVYAWTLTPDPSIQAELDIKPDHVVVVVRPPATEAHYHNPESEVLFQRAMQRLSATPDVKVVLLPRNRKQGEWVESRWPEWFREGKTVVPTRAVDGLNLLWYSDLVISGGGTMNREAAALGIPVYSIFRGKIGGVDRHLARTGRLVLLESPADVDTKLQICRRPRGAQNRPVKQKALETIVGHIQSLLREGQ